MGDQGSKRPLAVAIPGMNFPPVDEMEAHARKVEEAGFFDYLWTGDQMVVTVPRSLWTEDLVGPLAKQDLDVWMDPFVSAAVQARQLRNTKVGVSVIDAVRRPPAILAQSLMSLDHVAGGGSYFVLATGEVKQFAPYGVPREKPLSKLEDAVRFCKLLWNSQGRPVTAEGKASNLDRAILAMEPVGGKPPQVWVAGTSPRALEIAGKYADGWIVWAPGPVTPEEYADYREEVREYARQAGRDPDDLRYGCMFVALVLPDAGLRPLVIEHPIMKFNTVIVAGSSARWKKWGFEPPLGDDWFYAKDFCPQWWTREQCMDAISRIPSEACERFYMIGTPEELQPQLQAYVDAGCDFVIPCPYTPGGGENARFGVLPNETEVWAMLRQLKETNSPAIAPG